MPLDRRFYTNATAVGRPVRLPSSYMTHQPYPRLLLSIAAIGAVTMGAASAWRMRESGSRLSSASATLSGTNRLQGGDDTYASLLTAGRVERLERTYGFRRYQHSGTKGTGRVALDARQTRFVVANSRNAHPTADNDCNRGPDPVNPYPFSVSDAENVAIIGGIILGHVPQTSDWRYTYCNSAAVHIRRSPGVVVDGIRIAGAWDGVRASVGSSDLMLKNSWISDVRDDAVENDYLYSASVDDTLIDGSFQGISVKTSGSDGHNGARETLVLSGVLLRLREYPYRGKNWFGALTKNGATPPAIQIRNSVVAVDYRGGATWPDYWSRSWSTVVRSRNNVFLWLSDQPVPATFPIPPKTSGFKSLSGGQARDAWKRAKQNWIDCHPSIARMPSDPNSDIRRCDRSYWGGYHD